MTAKTNLTLQAFVLNADALNGFVGTLVSDGQRNLLELARGLAASPAWQDLGPATLMVREEPQPALAILGRFDEAANARLHALHWHLERVLPSLRYVTYAQAEHDCGTLAEKLIERFGATELARYRFTAIPRGGFIVLGMLAYVLGLKPEQLTASPEPDKPLVVVDDCAISGYQFKRYLARCRSDQVIFASLYAPPEVRAEIETREPNVLACLSAQDLHDHAPERLGDGYDAWRERWRQRAGDQSYWIGQTEHVCFPWNEPDVTVWNRVTEREELGWRLLPPEYCLKNRIDPERVSVQRQPQANGPLRPADRILYGTFEDQLAVCDTSTEEVFQLSDVAASMWQALVEHGSLEAATDALAEEYDVDKTTLADDLRTFADDLIARGMLVCCRH